MRQRKPRPSQRKPCEGCGGEKLPGQGQCYCAECHDLAIWRASKRQSTRTLVSRQPCIDCGGRKEPGHGRRVCQRCKTKRSVTRYCLHCPAQIVPPARLCATCRLKAIAKRREYDRLRHVNYRATHRAKRKALTQADLDRAKINYRLRRERAGLALVTRKAPGSWRSGARTRVDAAPLLPHLRARLDDTPSWVLGEVAKVRPHLIEAMVRGERPTIELASADRLCVALGLAFTLVYPEVAA